MKNEKLLYVPNFLVENMSCEALGLGAYVIAHKDQALITFSQIAKANRGTLKDLPITLDEFEKKGFAESIGEGKWLVTIPQPEGEVQMLVCENEKEAQYLP